MQSIPGIAEEVGVDVLGRHSAVVVGLPVIGPAVGVLVRPHPHEVGVVGAVGRAQHHVALDQGRAADVVAAPVELGVDADEVGIPIGARSRPAHNVRRVRRWCARAIGLAKDVDVVVLLLDDVDLLLLTTLLASVTTLPPLLASLLRLWLVCVCVGVAATLDDLVVRRRGLLRRSSDSGIRHLTRCEDQCGDKSTRCWRHHFFC